MIAWMTNAGEARTLSMAIGYACVIAMALVLVVAPGCASLSRVEGTAIYADGSPCSECRVLVKHPGFENLAETSCDESGRYGLDLPQGSYNAIAIVDDKYGKESLEFWAWNVLLEEDATIDCTIDKLEVYNLSVWNSKGGSQSFFLSFRPMSLDRFLTGPVMRDVEINGESVTVTDICPALDADHISVLVDGSPTEIESLQWYYEMFTSPDGAARQYLPVCLLQVVRPNLDEGAHDIRVIIEEIDTGAIGEAVTFISCNSAGLGF